MKATVYKTDGNKSKVDVQSFTEVQFFVGGDISILHDFYGNFYCNEDAPSFNLRQNPHFLDMVLGDVVELHGDPRELPYSHDSDYWPFDDEIEVEADR